MDTNQDIKCTLLLNSIHKAFILIQDLCQNRDLWRELVEELILKITILTEQEYRKFALTWNNN